MYWTDWVHAPAENAAKIWQANMDGSDVTVLISENLQWVNGLTLDLKNRM